MEKHEEKRCPRCGRMHVCKMNNIAHCDCSKVAIPREVADMIQQTYDDCLCLSCLRLLVEAYHERKESAE